MKDRKKERLCRTCWTFYTAVAVSHGRDCFRRWWRFCTAILHVVMAVLYAKGRSIRFCTRPSSAKMVLYAKGWSVHFCTRPSIAKIVLSTKGQIVLFWSWQTSDEFILFMKVRRSCFCTPRSKCLLWLGLEFITILNTPVLFKNHG